MARPVITAFKCIAQDPTISPKFTVGTTYRVYDHGIIWNTGYIRDDLNLQRFISKDHTFIVENNSELGRQDIRRAYFVPIFTPEPAQ